MTSNDTNAMTDLTPSANRIKLCGRMPILMIYQGHQGFPPESVIKKPNQIAFSHCCMVHISCFKVQSSIGHLVWFFDNVNSIVSGGNSWCLFSSHHTDTIYFSICERVYQLGTHVCSLCLKKKDVRQSRLVKWGKGN